VILFSIIALEKFAQTTENKITIQKKLQEISGSKDNGEVVNPMLKFETWEFLDKDKEETDGMFYMRRQVRFCSQWCLDNLCKLIHFKILIDCFWENKGDYYYLKTIRSNSYRRISVHILFLVLIPERSYSYTTVNLESINVILNNNDVSEYLKIAPHGLEVKKST
jgi:hypothetical protein